MKAFGQEQILGTAPIEKLLYYSMSLPVSTVSVGMPKLEHIEQNIQLARKFKPLSEAEKTTVVGIHQPGTQAGSGTFLSESRRRLISSSLRSRLMLAG